MSVNPTDVHLFKCKVDFESPHFPVFWADHFDLIGNNKSPLDQIPEAMGENLSRHLIYESRSSFEKTSLTVKKGLTTLKCNI